jgi:hypothetical protein
MWLYHITETLLEQRSKCAGAAGLSRLNGRDYLPLRASFGGSGFFSANQRRIAKRLNAVYHPCRRRRAVKGMSSEQTSKGTVSIDPQRGNGMSPSIVIMLLLTVGLLVYGFIKGEGDHGSGLKLTKLIMGSLAIGLLVYGQLRGKGEEIVGLTRSKDMLIQVFPLVVFAFIVGSMAQVLMPKGTVSHWIGKESGFRGILLGSVAGSFVPGGPYVSLPMAVSFLKAGAGVGTVVAFLTAWSVWAVGRLPLELGFLGVRFTLIRIASTCFVPPLAGLVAKVLFEHG